MTNACAVAIRESCCYEELEYTPLRNVKELMLFRNLGKQPKVYGFMIAEDDVSRDAVHEHLDKILAAVAATTMAPTMEMQVSEFAKESDFTAAMREARGEELFIHFDFDSTPCN